MQEMLTGALLNAGGMLFHWGLDRVMQFLGWIGWPGVIAIASGCLFLLSLSVKAVRFLTSRNGILASGGVMAATLFATWWLWPKLAAAAQPAKELASFEPSPLRAEGPKLKITAASPLLASKTAAASTATAEGVRRYPVVPPLAFNVPLMAIPAPLPLAVVVPPPRPPIVLQPKHQTPHHATHQQHASAARPAVPPARRPSPDTGLAQQMARQRAALNAQRAREMAAFNRQYNAMMGQAMGGNSSGMGGIHHGGMGQMGGHMSHGGHR